MSRRSSRGQRQQKTNRPQTLSRRTFLAGSALAGTSIALPGWLTGCGLLPSSITDFGQREQRTIHFDLSHVDATRTYTLTALRSASNGARLKVHTSESRARFRNDNALLRQIADKHLTHYVEDVDFPADALQHYWVMTDGDDGVPALVTSHLHVPRQAYTSLVAAKKAAAAAGQIKRVVDPTTNTKLQYLKVSRLTMAETATTLSTLNSIATPLDAARTVVFHHPEIMNLDPTLATKVLDVIDNLTGTGTSCTGDDVGALTALACSIASQGPGTTTSGWMRRVPAVDADGQPVCDSTGAQIYDNRPSDETLAAAEPVVQEVLREVYNDPTIRGNNFVDAPGITAVGATGAAGTFATGAAKAARAASTDFRVSLAYPGGDVASNLHGLLFRDFSVTDASTRKVSVEVENVYLRYLDAYVQFLQADKRTPITDSNGQPMAPQHLSTIPTDGAIMGIPLMDQGTLQRTTLSFTMPESASYANLLFATLGAGGLAVGDRDEFTMDDLIGAPIAWTLTVNIGIPSFLLALGVGLQGSDLLKSITSDKDVMAAIAAIFVPIYGTSQTVLGAMQGSARGPILNTANLLITMCIRSIPKLTSMLLGYASTEELAESMPFVGLGCRILGMTGGIARLAQTVGEVLSSPMVYDNTVSFAMDTTITVQHDPENYEFPADARMWIVRATYDGTVVREVCGEISTTQSAPIDVTLQNVPVGGQVQIDVWFLSADNWIVGQGGTGSWVATGDVDGDAAPVERWTPATIENTPAAAGAVNITIRELLVPLTASTVYTHREKLAYAGGAHTWVAGDAPTGTIGNLNTTSNDALHALNGITVNQAAAAVGYAWQTGTPAVAPCSGESTAATSLQLVQNLSLTQQPDAALKAPDCGCIDHRAIAYSLMAPLGGQQRSFYVDPVYGPYVIDSATTIAYKYFVRSVALGGRTDTTPFDAAAGQSWGWFSLASDGLAVHPLGHIASINTANSKLEILHLPGSAVADAEAYCATMLSGAGSVPGLLRAPVAIAAAPNGALLVLDAGNGRVQAFDTAGNVNNVFTDASGEPRNYFPLAGDDATRYLDLAVEASAGYLFILYYTGDGGAASDCVLDIYTPNGQWLTRTPGVNVARIALDYWRNLYTLNYESLSGPDGRIEPSLSQWTPSTPVGDNPNVLAAINACAS